MGFWAKLLWGCKIFFSSFLTHDLGRFDYTRQNKVSDQISDQEIYDDVVNKLHEYINWYLDKKVSKKWMSLFIRTVSIILVGISSAIPLLVVMIEGDQGQMLISPIWSSVALFLAGALVGWDKCFGFTAGWTRYQKTVLQLLDARDDFHYEWLLLSGKPQSERIDLAYKTVNNANKLVLKETSLWADIFQKGTDQLVGQTGKTAIPPTTGK